MGERARRGTSALNNPPNSSWHQPSHRPGRGLRAGLQVRRDRVARSGILTATVLLVVLGGSGALWLAHLHGRFHQLTTAQEKPETSASAATPGGQEMIHLQRAPHANAMEPEFTSALTLPGDGLMLMQATLATPGSADVPVLLASKASSLHGPVGSIQGAAFSVRVQTRQGAGWTEPAEALSGRPSSSQGTEMLPDGSRATAEFGDPPGAPAGATGLRIVTSVSLTSRGIEAGLVAKNVSGSDRAVTLSWLPQFLPPADGNQRLVLLPPAEGSQPRMRNGERTPAPADALREVPVASLGSNSRVYSTLRHGYLDQPPEVRLRYDAYTLRLTALTPSIQNLRVSKALDDSVLLQFSTADGTTDRPGREKPSVLHPGESLEWRVRLDAVANSTYTPPTP